MTRTRATIASRRALQARQAAERARLRRRRLLMAAGAVAVPLVLIAVLVVVRLNRPEPTAADPTLLAADIVAALAVQPSTLDVVGRGTVTTGPARLTGEPPLTQDGRPLVLYVGGEYCPFCAAQRWGLVVALSRFGTFSGLRATHSALDDTFPGTATVSFHGASYDSPYLAFAGVELAGNQRKGGSYAPLDSLTPAQTEVFRRYNAPPYVPAASAGAVPFVNFGNQALMSGSTFSPSLLSGMDQARIAAALNDPTSPIGKAVLGSANAFTTVLCGLTKGQPANVCASPSATAFPEVARAA